MNKTERLEQLYYESEKPDIMFEAGQGSPFIVFNVATHGNEYQPVAAVEKVIQELNSDDLLRGKVRFTLANPAALRARKRFLHSDLNRIYPGNILAQGEDKIATQMLELVKNADYVVDLHTAPDPPPFVILGTRNQERLQLAELAPIRPIVLFEASTPCAMVDFTKCGIGIELGGHDNDDSATMGVNTINDYLVSLGLIHGNKSADIKHDYYEIYRGLTVEEIPVNVLGNLQNFQPIANSLLDIQVDEEFSFPVLCGVKDYSPTYCYLAKKLAQRVGGSL